MYYSNVAYELAGRSKQDQGIILGTQLNDEVDDDDDDIDIRNRVIAMWNGLPQDSKALWQERADNWNARPVPGIIVRAQAWMTDVTTLKQFIRTDYIAVWKVLRRLVMDNVHEWRNTGREPATARFYPGNEFQLLSQSYNKKIVLQSLLLRVLTGAFPTYKRVSSNIVWQTASIILLHVGSLRRVKEIFDVAGLNPAKFEDRSGTFYAMCGKLAIRCDNSDIEETAYIVNEINRKFILHFTDNRTGECKKPRFCIVQNENGGRSGRYNLQDCTKTFDGPEEITFRVTDYKPVRVLFSLTNCNMRITTNRFVYTKDEQDDRTIKAALSS